MNTADFLIDTDDNYNIAAVCPKCGLHLTPQTGPSNIPNIWDLIRVASSHARTAHAMSAPAAIKGA